MSTIDDGGPAFPHDGQENYTGGMSLRDWFAGQALAGMCAHNDSIQWTSKEMAADAYGHADYMLAARKGGARE